MILMTGVTGHNGSLRMLPDLTESVVLQIDQITLMDTPLYSL